MDLHRELIRQHAATPVGAGLREGFAVEVRRVNPVCGDEITLRAGTPGIELTGPELTGPELTGLSYRAEGCSLSRASASMMHELLDGRPVEEIRRARAALGAMVGSRGADPGDEDVLGDAIALAGVATVPGRIACVLLPWTALDAILADPRTGIG